MLSRNWSIILFLLAVTLVFFRQIILEPGQMVYGSDCLLQGYIFEGFAREELLANRSLPFWNPYLYSGMPDTAAGMWGKHNGFASVTYRINDLMNISANAIGNFSDEVTVGTVQYYYNILQNVDATVYVRGYDGGADGLPTFPDLEYAVRLEVKF